MIHLKNNMLSFNYQKEKLSDNLGPCTYIVFVAPCTHIGGTKNIICLIEV